MKYIAISAAIIITTIIGMGPLFFSKAEASPVDSALISQLKGGTYYYAAAEYQEQVYLFEFVVGKHDPLVLYIANISGQIREKVTDTSQMEEIGKRVYEITDKKLSIKERFATKMCRIYRAQIQQQVDMFYIVEGNYPKDDLSDIANNTKYFVSGIPLCPVDQTAYRLDPATHEVFEHQEGTGTHRVPIPNFSDFKRNDTKNLNDALELTYGMLMSIGKQDIVGVPLSVVSFGDAPFAFVFSRKWTITKRVTGKEAQGLIAKRFPFLMARMDTARYDSCSDVLKSLKAAIDDVSTSKSGEHVSYQNASERAVCESLLQQSGCGVADIEARIGRFCSAPTGGAWKYATGVTLSANEYYVKAMAGFSKMCAMCATPRSFSPEDTSQCSNKMICK